MQSVHKDLFTRRWRRSIMPEPKELAIHINLVTLLRWCLRPDVKWWHTPNGEVRDLRTAQKLKAMGTLPGVADLQFHWCEMKNGEKIRRVLHLELKSGHRELADSQIEFALAVRLLGDEYHVARTVDEAVDILGARGLIRSDVTVCGKRWGKRDDDEIIRTAASAGGSSRS